MITEQDREVTYGIFAPELRPAPQHETAADTVAAKMLGRLLLRWTVYRRSEGRSLGWERVSHHWTRRAAWVASSRLRWAEAS